MALVVVVLVNKRLTFLMISGTLLRSIGLVLREASMDQSLPQRMLKRMMTLRMLHMTPLSRSDFQGRVAMLFFPFGVMMPKGEKVFY